MNLKCNCCDGAYNSFDVHFTSACPFNCAHCIDKKYGGIGVIKDYFVSFEKVFGIRLGSPYSCGCQTYLDMDKILPGFKTPLLLKRSCFLCEETLQASLSDGMKAVCRLFRPARNKYGVIYENGTLEKGWV